MSVEEERYYSVEDEPSTPLLSDVEMDDGSSSGERKKMSRKKKMMIAVGVLITGTAVVLLLTFLVIIPAIMQDVTDDEDISMTKATITNPTDQTFSVTSTIAFSENPFLPATVKMKDTDLSWDGMKIAEMTHNNKIDVKTGEQTLTSNVVVTDVEAMASFNQYLLETEKFDWHIHGHADAIAVSDKVDIVVDKDIAMSGFDGFPVDPVILPVSVYEGTPEVLYSFSTTILFSASNIALYFGQDMMFDLKSNGVKVGVGTIPNSAFETGKFQVNATIAMSGETTEEIAEVNYVCGRFISQIPTNVTMENFSLANPVSWLTTALASLKFDSVLPPVHEGVMDSLDMFVYVGDLTNGQWGGHFYNPLDTQLVLYSMVCDITFEDEVIAHVNEPDIEIAIPPKTHIVSANDMYAKIVLLHTPQIMHLLRQGGGLLDLDCQIKNTIGDFMVNLNYVQNNVNSSVHYGHPEDYEP